MFLKKIFITAFIVFAGFGFAGHVHAQEMDTLNFIKGRLGEDNIQVVDFSSSQEKWGSLPLEWADRLEGNFSGLEGVASFFLEEFEGPEGLNELRYQKSILESKKTRASTQAERDELDEQIKTLNEDIDSLTKVIKADLADSFPELDSQAAEEGAVLIFNELDHYFSAAQWGGLPYSIVRVLRDESDLCSPDEACNLATLAAHYEGLEGQEALDLLQQDLEGLTYTDPDGEEVELSSADVEIIFNAIQAQKFAGENQINAAVQSVVKVIRNILGSLAIFWIVIAGIRMTLAQGDETVITEQKQSILYALLGLVILLLLERLINILYGAPGQIQTTLRANRAFDAEVYGVVSFIRAIVGTIAVAILVRSGIRAIAAQGEEDEITKQRTSLAWVIAGLVVIAINRVIVENIFIAPTNQDDQIYSSNIANIIGTISNVFKFFLAFLGIIALGLLIWGAGMMITNYGDEEMVTKAKTLIKNAIIGILVIIAAYAIVATLVSFG